MRSALPTVLTTGTERSIASASAASLDIFWLKDNALDDPDLLPPPDEDAAEIVESLELAQDRYRSVAKAQAMGQCDPKKLVGSRGGG